MFREIAYTSLVMSFTSFGTEIIYRAKLVDDENNSFYFIQSDLVISLTIIQTLVSLYIIRKLATIEVLRMRLLNVFVDAFLIAAIALRASYNFFLPLESIRYSLYNITSFFLCIQAFTFALFWFYRGPYEDQGDTYSLRPPRRSRRHNNSSTPTVHRYDEEIDYTLPSYSEVPAPPAYSKIDIPENSEDTSEATSNAETSSNINQSTETVQHEDSAHPNRTERSANNTGAILTDHVAIRVESVAIETTESIINADTTAHGSEDHQINASDRLTDTTGIRTSDANNGNNQPATIRVSPSEEASS